MSTFTPARRSGKRDTFVPAKRAKRDVFVPAIRLARQCEPGFTPAKRSSSKGQVFVPAKRPAPGDKFYPAMSKGNPDTTAQAHPLVTHPYLVGKLSGSDVVHEGFDIGIPNPNRRLGPIRGESFPEWYNGFMRNTTIMIVKEKEKDAECRLLFGPDRHRPLAKTFPFKFPIKFEKDEIATICFFDGQGINGTTHFEVMEIPWPDQLTTDIFDYIWLERVNKNSVGRDLKIKRIEVILNDVNICNIGWPHYNTCRQYLDISPFIERDRLAALRYNDNRNSMLKLLAGELGQAWSPKYGSKWLKVHLDNPERFVFTPHPRN